MFLLSMFENCKASQQYIGHFQDALDSRATIAASKLFVDIVLFTLCH